MTFRFCKAKYFTSCTVAIVAFAAGLLTAGGAFRLKEVKADSDRVFELRIYHALPGKLPAMDVRFRDATSKLLVKHNLNVIGYWVPTSKSPAWDNTFVFLLAHSRRDEAEKHWQAMAADPAFQEIIKSEQQDRLLDRADTTYMLPTEFSPMK